MEAKESSVVFRAPRNPLMTALLDCCDDSHVLQEFVFGAEGAAD